MAPDASMPVLPRDEDWLAEFHAGERRRLEELYREYYATVDRAVGRLLTGPDRETVVHEVFLRILDRSDVRQSFRGGSVAAWLSTVARNHAVDFRRRLGREVLEATAATDVEPEDAGPEDSVEAAELVERFRRQVLPEAWQPVFDACFLRRLTQRAAAAELGISRTTLLYRQHRVRALLRRFLLENEP